MTTYHIFWKENEIGQFIEESMDMGYLDGKMISYDSENSNQFIKIASELDHKLVMENPKNGIRASLKDGSNFLINVLVLGITEKMELSLKMIVGKQETIDWYLENVTEGKLLTTHKNDNESSTIIENSNNNNLWSKLKKMWS